MPGLKLELGGKELGKGEVVGRDSLSPLVSIIAVKAHIANDDYSEAQSPPTLAFKSSNANPTAYLAICIDLDAPYKTIPFLGPILHWLQPSLKADSDSTLRAQSEELVSWAPPGPPPGAAPHRYVFVLYEQREDLSVAELQKQYPKPLSVAKRMRWNLESFEKTVGLGEKVAAAWFESS